jgi:DNA-binding transcriptional MerR regulator
VAEKSPEAFRTISEVASDLDVPQHVLRFWESKFSQIKPLKRGGGRRYYRPEDVELLRGVRTLLYHDGYTIKGVQKVFREQGARFIVETGRAGEGDTVAGLARGVVHGEAPLGQNTREDGEVPSPQFGQAALPEQDLSALLSLASRLEAFQRELVASRFTEDETEE